MAKIDIWLTDPIGTRIMPLAHFDRLNYTRAVNDVGELEIVLPGHFDTSLARVDSLILVWRDGRLDTETAWLVRKLLRTTNNLGVQAVTLTAVSGLDLVRRRIVLDQVDGTNQLITVLTAAADDLIKLYVQQNIGSLAGSLRSLPSTIFDVAADTTSAPITSREAGYLNLLRVCQDIAKESAEAGTPVFFDMVYLPESNKWEFRTYTGSRGINKASTTGAPQTLSVEYGSVGTEQLEDDYRDEVTFVYAGGRGIEQGRLVATAEDTARSGRSVFGRCEAFASGSSDDYAVVETEARSALQRGRPWRTYDANIISTASSQYGRDWGFGDIVTVNAYGAQFDARDDAVQVTIDNLDGGRESVRARLTNTAAL